METALEKKTVGIASLLGKSLPGERMGSVFRAGKGEQNEE